MKTKNSHTVNSTDHSSRHCGTVAALLITLGLACSALSPQARASCQEGCDPVNFNTFLGEDALLDHSGVSNTAIGWHALKNTANSAWNTAIGSGALEAGGGYDNTATGVAALGDNLGHSNTATGSSALSFNTAGSDNTATGFSALGSNSTGDFNVANGMWALTSNTTGAKNTATGYGALFSSTTSDFNTASGYSALSANTTGSNNTAFGYSALSANTGGNNIALGSAAGRKLTTGNQNIDIGNIGVAGESRTIRIGTAVDQTATFIAGISGSTVAGGVGVVVDTNGHLGTVVSSARFKEAIKPMAKASEGILSLQPVTFRYKHDLDPDGIPQFGLVAEQVAKVNPDLVARDDQGKPYTVRYEAVNAMLLNEFLKEHRTVEELKTTVAKQEATIAQQEKASQITAAQQEREIHSLIVKLSAQESQIRKVSEEVKMSKPAPQLVVNGQ